MKFTKFDTSATQFCDFLYGAFCKLANGGSFQRYKHYKRASNSRDLELLSKLAHAQIWINARTYIVPLQSDLDLIPIVDAPSEVWFMSISFEYCSCFIKIEEACLSRGLKLPVFELA